MNSHEKREPDASRPKKLYRSPVIQVYGSIRAITNSIMSSGTANDGAVTGNKKT